MVRKAPASVSRHRGARVRGQTIEERLCGAKDEQETVVDEYGCLQEVLPPLVVGQEEEVYCEYRDEDVQGCHLHSQGDGRTEKLTWRALTREWQQSHRPPWQRHNDDDEEQSSQEFPRSPPPHFLLVALSQSLIETFCYCISLCVYVCAHNHAACVCV